MTKIKRSATAMPPASARTSVSLARIRWQAARPIILVAAFIATTYLALAALVISVDPYNIYRWGAPMKADPRDTPRDEVIDWIDVVTKDPAFNTFLVGSSITAMYSPEYLENILGPDTRAANLSYGGPRPRDRDLVMKRLVANPYAKHVIVTFDWTYIQDPAVTNSGFPTFLYDDDITNDLRMVNLRTVKRTFAILRGNHTYSNPDDRNYAKFVRKMDDNFQLPEEMARIGRMIERSRQNIGASSGRTCDTFHAVKDQLVPDIRALSARGVQVDILFPIVSYAFYFVRQNDISPTLLDETLTARHCLVDAVGDLPDVRIFALDGIPSIAGDLANFREVGHVYNPVILRRFVSGMNTGNDRLTRANFAQYESGIRSAVAGYQLKNSRVRRDAEPAKP